MTTAVEEERSRKWVLGLNFKMNGLDVIIEWV